MSRKTEFTWGLIGGIIGVIVAFIALAIGGVAGAFNAEGASMVVSLGWFALLFAIIGIVGGALVKNHTKVGGWLMIVGAIGGIISISIFYILPCVLLIIGGLMALIKKK